MGAGLPRILKEHAFSALDSPWDAAIPVWTDEPRLGDRPVNWQDYHPLDVSMTIGREKYPWHRRSICARPRVLIYTELNMAAAP